RVLFRSAFKYLEQEIFHSSRRGRGGTHRPSLFVPRQATRCSSCPTLGRRRAALPPATQSTTARSALGCGTRQRSRTRSEEHTSELQSRENLVCRLLLEKKKRTQHTSEPGAA